MVSPLACGVDETWNRLLAGQSAGGRITRFDASDLPCQIACEIPRGDGSNGTFNPEQWMEAKEIRRERRYVDLLAVGTGEGERPLFEGRLSLIWAA